MALGFVRDDAAEKHWQSQEPFVLARPAAKDGHWYRPEPRTSEPRQIHQGRGGAARLRNWSCRIGKQAAFRRLSRQIPGGSTRASQDPAREDRGPSKRASPRPKRRRPRSRAARLAARVRKGRRAGRGDAKAPSRLGLQAKRQAGRPDTPPRAERQRTGLARSRCAAVKPRHSSYLKSDDRRGPHPRTPPTMSPPRCVRVARAAALTRRRGDLKRGVAAAAVAVNRTRER